MGFTTHATTTAGRDGHVRSADGAIDLDLAMPKPDGSPGKPHATNPEALFASGYSACYGSALMAVAGSRKIRPEAVHVTAEVTLSTDDNDFRLAVVLKPKIDGVEREVAEELAAKAHEVCPYSKATRGNIPVRIEVQ